MMKRLGGLVICSLFLMNLSPVDGAAQGANGLPQDHEYQRQLRQYIGGLKEQDFEVELKEFALPKAGEQDAEPDMDELCRLWVLTLKVPSIGGIRAPASQFTLGAIEGERTVLRPPVDPLPLAWLTGWDHPCNPYHDSNPIKLRAFVVAALDMIMLDGLHERSAGRDWVVYGLQTGRREGRAAHSDNLGGTLIWLGYVYLQCRDALPPEARTAYKQGLKKLVKRLDKWGPTSLMTDMDLFAPVGLTYIAEATGDPELKRIAESYSKPLFTHPRYFHPAGYWVDIQGYDASYTGISFYFGNWAALASNWDFAGKAVEEAYRLRAHMSLPEPDGKSYVGPTHFSPRTSADSYHDQWNWYPRNVAGAIVTDQAAHLVRPPSDETIRKSPAQLVARLNALQKPTPKAQMKTWAENHWNTRSFNYGYEHYRKGFYERMRKLEKENSPLRVVPFERQGQFVRNFGDAFLVARFPDYGLIIHTGPVGTVEPDWHERAKWMPTQKPFGFSGGALSAFWTPEGGSVLLGRRGGAQGTVYDRYEQWRIWPFHAVTGETQEGKVFTSGRILQPKVKYDLRDNGATVRVEGAIPKTYAGQGKALEGDIGYGRSFEVAPTGVSVHTELQSDGKDKLAELCETIPVYLGPGRRKGGWPVAIHFKVAGQWAEAGTDYREKVEAARVKRYGGTVLITFAEPQRVKLSPREWMDGYQSRAMCRTVLVDLLGGSKGAFRAASLQYTITPAKE